MMWSSLCCYDIATNVCLLEDAKGSAVRIETIVAIGMAVITARDIVVAISEEIADSKSWHDVLKRLLGMKTVNLAGLIFLTLIVILSFLSPP